jgi:cytochrome b6-f complex iron-sulfur subunit
VRNSADRYIERLLAGRRPKAFTPTEEDLARIRAAIDLAGARTEQARPDEAFVTRLRDRLAAQQPAAGRQPKRQLLRSMRPARRRFLRAGLLTATAFATGLATESLLAPGSGTSSAEQSDLLPSHGTWQTVAAGAQLREGAVLDFDLGAVTGFVQRTGGHVRAVSGVCTHQACRLTLDGPRTGLVCPCHGATFALDGEPLRAHRPLPPLPRLPVREHRGDIQVYGPSTQAPPPAQV